MKTKILLFSLFVFAVSFSAKSADYVIYSSAELASTVAAAVDGDVIIIAQSDSVISQTALNVTKRITIKAASGLTAKPQIKLGIILKNGSSIRLEGLKFFYDNIGSTTNSDSKYAIQAVAEVASIDSIKIINCEAHNFGRGLIRADNTTNIATIGKVVIDNCIISNASSFNSGYATIGLKTAKVSNISITNTTFVNGLGAVLYSEDAITPLNLLVDHVTIYNCDKIGNKPIIGFKSPVGSTLAVKNSIAYFSGIKLAADTMLNNAINFSLSAGALELSNSIICPNLFASKIIPMIKPENTSTLWTAYSTVAVDSLSMDANYKVTTYPTQLNTIGDPRGYKVNSAVPTVNQAAFKVYPNPTSDMIYLEKSVSKIEVINILGQKLITASNSNSVKLTHLSNGNYFVRVTDELGKISVSKVIKN